MFTTGAAIIGRWADSFEPRGGGGERAAKRAAKRRRLTGLTMADLATFFEMSSLQKLAVDTIQTALMHDDIVWCTKGGTPVSGNRPPPPGIDYFVTEMVRHCALVGFAVWRVTERGALELADIEHMTIAFDGTAWAPCPIGASYADTGGWCISFTDEPRRPPEATAALPVTASVAILRSACAKSFDDAARAEIIEMQWQSRDLHNSRPAAYTMTNPASYVAPASSARGAVADEVTAYRSLLGEGRASFNHSIKTRAERIALMDDYRDNGRGDEVARGQFADSPRDNGAPRSHVEHNVTDFKEAKETKTLIGGGEGPLYYARARQSALCLMGVPPQALGESVTTERTGSNHAQYATSLTLFKTTVGKYRAAVSDALKGGRGATRLRFALGFRRCVTTAELDALMPVLQTERAVQLLACTHGLPPEYFDPGKVATVQSSLGGGAESPGQPSKKTVGERTIANTLDGSGAAS